MISIITPAYNASRFIAKTIESVQAQSYTDWEMLIADDVSQDNTVEIVQSYMQNDKRIKLTVLDDNLGAANARNTIIRKAEGKYIAFLDSDDLWKPDKLEKQLVFMEKHNLAFTCTAYECITEDGRRVLYTVNAPKRIGYRRFLRNTAIGTLTVMINREMTGEFEIPDIRSSHDMALWLDIMKRGFKAYGLNENLAKYRLVGDSNTSAKWKAAMDVWKVFRDIEKLNAIYSAYNFAGYVWNAVKKRLK